MDAGAWVHRGGVAAGRLHAFVPLEPVGDAAVSANASGAAVDAGAAKRQAPTAASAPARRSSRAAQDAASLPFAVGIGGSVPLAALAPPPVGPETVLLLYRPPLRAPPPLPVSLLASHGAAAASSERRDAAAVTPSSYDEAEANAFAALPQPVSVDFVEGRYASAEAAARSSALKVDGFAMLVRLFEASRVTPCPSDMF